MFDQITAPDAPKTDFQDAKEELRDQCAAGLTARQLAPEYTLLMQMEERRDTIMADLSRVNKKIEILKRQPFLDTIIRDFIRDGGI